MIGLCSVAFVSYPSIMKGKSETQAKKKSHGICDALYS